MNGRHELKFHINRADYMQLRARLHVLARPDRNAGPDGGYRVRSVYFDNYQDKAVVEKLSGLSRREKFRLRLYNGDALFIRVEKKSKANRLCYKESAIITAEQCVGLLTAGVDAIKAADNPLLTELYAKMRYQHLRPRIVVDYYREAYVYRAGNVRVTFDSHIRTSNHVFGFLDPGLATIPAAGSIILEVKYDGFLPDIMRDIIQIGHRNETEFSKYVVSRLV